MRICLIASALLLAALSGCETGNTNKAKPAQATAAPDVETVPVTSRQLDLKVSLPAQLLPYESVDIYPKVTGFLDSIRVDVGSRVTQGEELMRLSAPELVAQRSQAEAAVHAAESQLATAQAKLASDQGTYLHLSSAAETPGVVAQNDVMVAEQTVAADKGTVSAGEHNLGAAKDALRSVSQLESYLTIKAPFSGVVTIRNLHPGALTGPASGQAGSQPIVRIVDTDRLRVVVPIPEAEVGEIKQQEPVSFTVPAYPGEVFHAPIARIAHDVDVNTRTMHVELDVRNSDGKLAPGSFVTVSWPVRRHAATLFVPATAVTGDQQHTFVIRVRDNKAEWVNVQTGQSANGETEVFGDLHAGDQIVRIASDSIRNGQNVTVRMAKQS
ncbi:efflux RND transporter periplasmic adaptor subunit [Occallatibacter riparius]|uniref:Efflux RND transporter periplasmic adaptor subunit n=1 Tax=Occallatibacter riparius TaxID=1002689 RepID=A0A9J7BPA2_9BACT|nr:efflux RND transporter periplasmic adaptor subunit [Occallatibacter riparius]UWZ84579.1 efflux RND transporter periplasmic adaptor subunit [Occallatibacter riparius]